MKQVIVLTVCFNGYLDLDARALITRAYRVWKMKVAKKLSVHQRWRATRVPHFAERPSLSSIMEILLLTAELGH